MRASDADRAGERVDEAGGQRMDLRQAPLMRLQVAVDDAQASVVCDAAAASHRRRSCGTSRRCIAEVVGASGGAQRRAAGARAVSRRMWRRRWRMHAAGTEAFFRSKLGEDRRADGAVRAAGCARGRHADRGSLSKRSMPVLSSVSARRRDAWV